MGERSTTHQACSADDDDEAQGRPWAARRQPRGASSRLLTSRRSRRQPQAAHLRLRAGTRTPMPTLLLPLEHLRRRAEQRSVSAWASGVRCAALADGKALPAAELCLRQRAIPTARLLACCGCPLLQGESAHEGARVDRRAAPNRPARSRAQIRTAAAAAASVHSSAPGRAGDVLHAEAARMVLPRPAFS
ncbi:hypothetical protein FA09DRAFT_327282 [Tilletiopsis washingtonensis]|jgi:hypothetical protein|uniref:Uncharacterized protein n=1 Tax=Tilletiopsis washingtonensis TaxID=58919 RepID=A0A316ZJN0_9BASI|nr:hypothetical protein FA09DRAFT_327282 [Tilletiopsis washingtonensis]PWO01339.1 hypothetical protein FA09DRAFT_327282 [Tilletiopsis washingtonensis]